MITAHEFGKQATVTLEAVRRATAGVRRVLDRRAHKILAVNTNTNRIHTPEGGALRMWYNIAKGRRVVPGTARPLSEAEATEWLGLSTRRSALQGIEKWSPVQKEVYNRAGLMHELDERKYNVNGVGYGMHNDPAVILLESNLARGMTGELAPVGRRIVSERTLLGEVAPIKAVMPGFEYGKTRLSRHAIKRMSTILAGKARGE